MAIPVLFERITKEDTDSSRFLSGHEVEGAFRAINAGFFTLAEFKTYISSTADDDTDLDNLAALITGNQANKNMVVLGICGIVILGNLHGLTAAQCRTKLGIDTP
ncbi:hypothetical protein LCGC14_3042290 [marine sediment metagenome]|uniref:Uncharacterized protein n=1 Tax=marine sediment metagenome TaxID=412755 RepID=A0A0F8ZF51_9ZZZZ